VIQPAIDPAIRQPAPAAPKCAGAGNPVFPWNTASHSRQGWFLPHVLIGAAALAVPSK